MRPLSELTGWPSNMWKYDTYGMYWEWKAYIAGFHKIKLWTTMFLVHLDWGPPGGRGGTCSLVPRNKLARSPVPQKLKICFLKFPVPQYCLCSPKIFAFVPLFPWNKYPFSPVPQNLGGPLEKTIGLYASLRLLFVHTHVPRVQSFLDMTRFLSSFQLDHHLLVLRWKLVQAQAQAQARLLNVTQVSQSFQNSTFYAKVDVAIRARNDNASLKLRKP